MPDVTKAEAEFLASIDYDPDVGSLLWEEGWLANMEGAEYIPPKQAADWIVAACHEAATRKPLIEAAQNLVRYMDDHPFAIMAASGVATQINALLDVLCAAVDGLKDLADPIQEQS